MITLTMECARCGKNVSQDMTDRDLSNDLIRQFGFTYINDGKSNLLLCHECENLYKELQARLRKTMKNELCEFFDNCEEEEKDNGNTGGKKNG